MFKYKKVMIIVAIIIAIIGFYYGVFLLYKDDTIKETKVKAVVIDKYTEQQRSSMRYTTAYYVTIKYNKFTDTEESQDIYESVSVGDKVDAVFSIEKNKNGKDIFHNLYIDQ